MKGAKEEVHVVMLPWSAFGHLIPFLDLSIALAKLGIHVSYISTPRNILRLPKIPPNLSPLIHFISIPLPNLHPNPLPENAEATVDIPPDRMGCLKMACDLLREPVRAFVAQKLPDWIVVDFFQHWAGDIAQEFNIPIVTYCITSANSMAFFTHPEILDGEGEKLAPATPIPRDFTVSPDWFDFPSQVSFRAHEANDFQNVYSGLDATGISSFERVTKLFRASRAIIVRSSMEFEGEYFKVFMKNLNQRLVFPLGFLPQEKLGGSKRTGREEPWRRIFDWLDKQQPKSVVFVGFGSECKLKKEEIFEIAYGVELSGLPFLWALRKPDWASDDGEGVPPGFITRTVGKGVVQFGWAPQREILAHPCIGGSLFHAGWASIVETIIYGHCLVLLPFVIFQPLDSRLMVEKGLGIEVKRDEDGCFGRNDIANALRKAMVSKEGEAMRKRTEEVAEGMFGNRQLNDGYINRFAEYLRSGGG